MCVFGAAEKIQSLSTAGKSQEKVEAKGTGFSVEFFGSQSVETVCFARKTKIQKLTTSCQSLTSLRLSFLNPYDFSHTPGFEAR